MIWIVVSYIFIIASFLLLPSLAFAQPAPNNPAASQCKTVTVNAQGVSKNDITVSSSVVTVMAASAVRCSAVLHNTGSSNARCFPVGDTPTSTAGKLIKAGEVFILGLEGQEEWRCIRVSSDTTMNVAESTP